MTIFPRFAFAAHTLLSLLTVLLAGAALLAPAARAAPAGLNATLRFDSPLVAFSAGWNAAQFQGETFAFADGLNDEVQVTLPRECPPLETDNLRPKVYNAC